MSSEKKYSLLAGLIGADNAQIATVLMYLSFADGDESADEKHALLEEVEDLLEGQQEPKKRSVRAHDLLQDEDLIRHGVTRLLGGTKIRVELLNELKHSVESYLEEANSASAVIRWTEVARALELDTRFGLVSRCTAEPTSLPSDLVDNDLPAPPLDQFRDPKTSFSWIKDYETSYKQFWDACAQPHAAIRQLKGDMQKRITDLERTFTSETSRRREKAKSASEKLSNNLSQKLGELHEDLEREFNSIKTQFHAKLESSGPKPVNPKQFEAESDDTRFLDAQNSLDTAWKAFSKDYSKLVKRSSQQLDKLKKWLSEEKSKLNRINVLDAERDEQARNEVEEKKRKIDVDLEVKLKPHNLEVERLWRTHIAESKDIVKHLPEEDAQYALSLLEDVLGLLKAEFKGDWPFPGRKDVRLDDLNGLSIPHFQTGPVVYWGKEWTIDKKIYVIGDLHGDWESFVSSLATTHFFEDDDTVLVFVGDYGDRGISTLRVFLCALDLRRLYPDRVLLLRGNHEELYLKDSTLASTTTNKEYIFGIKHLIAPLEKEPKSLVKKLVDIMDVLPDVLLIEDGTMILHGFVPPRFGGENRGEPDISQRAEFRVDGLGDLLRSELLSRMRWQRFEGSEEILFVWPQSFRESDTRDWSEFKRKTGIKRAVRGHDPVSSGFKTYDTCPEVVTLCTATTLGNPIEPGIAKLKWNSNPEVVRFERNEREEP